MRCKICGAVLKKDGDICTNCYKIYQEEEELKKDTNEIITVRRKYLIAYNLCKDTWIFIILILSLAICLTSKEWLGALGLVFGFVLIIGTLLFIDKRLSLATKATFCERKVDYVFNFFFINSAKTVKYENIKDIMIFKQTFWQKKFDLGDICVYAKGAFPGATLLNGFQIKNVENPSEVLNKLSEIIGPMQ